MVDQDHDNQEAIRPPTREDLVRICGRLNEVGAEYVVLGGMALIELGLNRGTMDVDLLVNSAPENVARVCEALTILEDGASRDVRPGDIQEYNVVRIHDEITVDLMGSACGLDFEQAKSLIEWRILDNVRIPFASVELLWKTKQTCREKDALDRCFLKQLMQLGKGKKL